MAMKEVSDKLPEIWKLGPDNTSIVGYYRGIRTTEKGPLVDMVTDDGEAFAVSGNTDLIRKLTSVPIDVLTKFTYKGTLETKNGQTMKIIGVAYDKDIWYGMHRK